MPVVSPVILAASLCVHSVCKSLLHCFQLLSKIGNINTDRLPATKKPGTLFKRSPVPVFEATAYVPNPPEGGPLIMISTRTRTRLKIRERIIWDPPFRRNACLNISLHNIWFYECCQGSKFQTFIFNFLPEKRKCQYPAFGEKEYNAFSAVLGPIAFQKGDGAGERQFFRIRGIHYRVFGDDFRPFPPLYPRQDRDSPSRGDRASCFRACTPGRGASGIDVPTILLLFGFMIISAQFRLGVSIPKSHAGYPRFPSLPRPFLCGDTGSRRAFSASHE